MTNKNLQEVGKDEVSTVLSKLAKWEIKEEELAKDFEENMNRLRKLEEENNKILKKIEARESKKACENQNKMDNTKLEKSISEGSANTFENTRENVEKSKINTIIVMCPNVVELMKPKHFIKVADNADKKELIVIYTYGMLYSDELYTFLLKSQKNFTVVVRDLNKLEKLGKKPVVKETTHYKHSGEDYTYVRSDAVDVTPYFFDDNLAEIIKGEVTGITFDTEETFMFIRALSEACSRVIKEQMNFEEDKAKFQQEITVITDKYGFVTKHLSRTAESSKTKLITLESKECDSIYHINLGDLYYTTKEVETSKKGDTITVGEITDVKNKSSVHQYIKGEKIKIRLLITSPSQLD